MQPQLDTTPQGSMPRTTGAAFTGSAAMSGDQSGNLTGGVIALLFNELRALRNDLKDNSELQ